MSDLPALSESDLLDQLAHGVLDRSGSLDGLPALGTVQPSDLLIFRIWVGDGGEDADRTAALASARMDRVVTPGEVRALASVQSWEAIALRLNQNLLRLSHRIVTRQLAVGALAGVQALIDIARDEGASATARVRAATVLLDRSGHHPVLNASEHLPHQVVTGTLTDLTDAELADAIEAYAATPGDAQTPPDLRPVSDADKRIAVERHASARRRSTIGQP